MPVTTGVVVGLAVAIGTKKHEILETVVVPVAVDVMERECQGPTLPIDQAALTVVGARWSRRAITGIVTPDL